ncbi:MAG: DUF4258 domain-containing protein [Gammaproteobacteria bacterium]
MKTLAQIRQQLAAGRFDFSRHAFKRAVERNISEQEIRTAGARAEIIEEVSRGQAFAYCSVPQTTSIRSDYKNSLSLMRERVRVREVNTVILIPSTQPSPGGRRSNTYATF